MDIHKLIAGLSPETYCQPGSAKQVRRLLQAKNTVSPPEAVLLAAAPAEPKPANLIPLERLAEMDPFDCPGLQSPRAQFTYSRDAMAESIEAFYFSILNQLEQLEGWQVFKLVDELQSSLLATPFADAAEQQSQIQRQVFEGLDAIHTLTQDMLDTVQQLEAQPSGPEQIDAPRNPSHAATNPELELRRARLRSQLSLLKLRAAAIRPWLQQGDLSGVQASHSPSLVNAFNTAVFQLMLLAIGPDVLPEALQSGVLPQWMSRRVQRGYRPVLVLELRFRARPHRSRSQGYAYRGKAEVTMTSYGLHDNELSLLRNALETNSLRNSLQIGAGEAANTLSELVHQIERLVHPKQAAPAQESTPDQMNPFSAVFSLFSAFFRWISRNALDKAFARDHNRPDTSLESVVRSMAIFHAQHALQKLVQTLKGPEAN